MKKKHIHTPWDSTLHFQCLEKLQAERELKSSALPVSTITVLSSQNFCKFYSVVPDLLKCSRYFEIFEKILTVE